MTEHYPPEWVVRGLSPELREKALHLPGPWWYMWLYLRVGGIPFTYDMRAWGRHNPALAMLAIVALAYGGWRLLDINHVAGYAMTAIVYGLAAHIFWGGKRTK